MISRKAVSTYLSRQLDSFEWVKELAVGDLEAATKKVTPRPQFHTKLYRHQKEMFLLGLYVPQFLFFADMGTGKTAVVLNLIKQLKRMGEATRALVLVPNVANMYGWVEECNTHTPDMKCVALEGTGELRWACMTQHNFGGDLHVINYQGLLSIVSTPQPSKSKSKKKQWVMDKDRVDALVERYDILVLDESQACRNHQSLTYQVCDRLAGQMPVRYALTGTPFGRDPQQLWPQFHIIDRGETLGYTLGIFRAAFFDRKKRPWGGPYSFDYKLKRGMEPTLHRFIQNRSIRYRSDECLDLPEQIFIRRRVPWPEDAASHYSDLSEQLKACGGDYRALDNMFIRMRQLTSGFMVAKDDDTEERLEVDLPTNPKLDELWQVLEEVPKDRKVVIFHDFIYSGQRISDLLTKQGVKHERLWSGTKDARKAVHTFQNDETCRVFVVNSASGGSGLNLQVANYVIYYESPVDPVVRQQSEKRCHRTGQTRTTYYYDLLVKGSVDEKIYWYLREGKSLFEALVNGQEVL